LSSAACVALVRAANAVGQPVTCDVVAKHLQLIDVDIGYFEAQFRLDPPLLAELDRYSILAELADGTIYSICSHHNTH
ncbi:dihydroorotase, partial [Burkholderia pseudomallei]